MKKIWLGIGAAVIVILLLLQTKFNVFMRLEQNGYAIADSEIKKTLMLNPEEVSGDVAFSYYRFEALDYIYQRGNTYYMGEKKKQEIDLGFPLYVNGGAGILFTDNSGTLFDVDFEAAESYSGLTVSEGISYNPGGDRADAAEFIFCGLSNGMFINLDTLSYEDRGEMREVDRNSIIYFNEEYFTYSEQSSGEGNYQVCRNINADDIVSIHGQELTYRELLLKLQVIGEKKLRASKSPEATQPVATMTPELAELEESEVLEAEEERQEKEEKEKEEKEKTEKEKTEKTKEPKSTPQKNERENNTTQQVPQQNPAPNAPGSQPQSPQGQPSTSQPPRGTRPDNLRPDKDVPKEPTVVDYVKPTVTVNGVTAGIYRIMLDVTVDDPARRLHTLRKVQFEFYEVGSNGKETLVYRTYTGASNQKLSAGDGSIKPDTTYRINAYFTYFDEYDKMIVESIPLDQIITGLKITTGSFSDLGVIDLGNPQPAYYYDRYLELPSVRYADGSDEEAIYGINRNAGIKLIVEGNSLSNSGFKFETSLDAAVIRNFKSRISTGFKSAANLEAKSKYKFTIIAEDYFGNRLTVKNNTGEFETCKSRPVGNLEVKENKLGNFQMQVKMTDPDESAIPAEAEAGSDYDIYLVYSRERSEVNPVTKEECDAYLVNGVPVEGGKIAFAYKFSEREYRDSEGKIKIDQIVQTANLDLNEKYFAYLYCDYNLNNKKGDVRFGEIASLNFTSASLSSLGDIYVKVDISHVMAHSVNIAFTLNADRTVDELEKLLSSVRFNIVRTNGEEEVTDSYMQFDTNAMTDFSGYDHGTNESPIEFPWESSGNPVKPVLMDANFFNGSKSDQQHELKSMTDYTIVPVIKAKYNGKEYDMNVKLSTSTFKTMKEPATVEVENLLLAAGTLRFNVKINDPDGAIVGNSGHMVRMNLYQQDGTFIQAIRIPKNTEEFQKIEINNLQKDRRLKLTFIAVEYNEGYTNSTYESNKILREILIDDSLDLTGSIKLQDIEEGSGSGKLNANITATINDKDKVLNNSCYYIQVQKNGEDVTANYPASYEVPGNGGSYNGTKIETPLSFAVDKGKNTYQLTLYVMINGQELVLDTLTFTSEQTVISINNAEEFIWKIKNNPSGKFVVTNNITLDSSQNYRNPTDSAKEATPRRITNNFNGQIDFQGYTLDYTYRSSGSGLFANIGSKGEISNLVLNVKMENSGSRVSDDGVLCRLNYGRIHDVMVNYKGGEIAKNEHIGLLCRINAVSGVIENFVVSNEPEEGTMPFTAWTNAGLVCASNSGIIRNGYAYGDPIFTDISEPSVGGELRVGGIAGAQGSMGRISNVFSMVDVIVANKKRSSNQSAAVYSYGSIVGRAWGRVSNCYGIGESFYGEALEGENKNIKVGPAVGYFDGRNNNVYYWNETGTDYTDTKQKRIGLESLYDYGWQAQLLGSQFITSNVEVGFYPHVKLSSELPAQPNIPLPDRAGANLVELVSAEVVEYVDNKQAAIVNFRFSNTKNAEILKINIQNLTTEIEVDSIASADGFTTLTAKVSNPTRFCSAYEITGVECYLSGKRTVKFNPNPLLLVDFYRNISTPEEWYEYVVKQPTENARLTADIDFSGVAANRIVVTREYTGKLDGGSADGHSRGYALKNITIQGKNQNNVFANNVKGYIMNLCVENLTLGTDAAPYSRPGLIRTLYGGIVDNVHIQNMSVTGYEYVGGLAGGTTSGSEITNCSVSKIRVEYREPANSNTVGRIGGLAGSIYETRISNCYVRELDMEVADIRECEGAGGLIGWAQNSAIDSAYSTGAMTVRGVRVGGIVGYYSNGETSNCVKNLLSGTDVFSYQDKVGGLIGEGYVSALLNDRNNVSGIALGNVFANNPLAENVSYTIGDMAGVRLSFHGSEVQLLNGLVGQEKDANTLGLLSLEQLQNAETYTGEAGMDDVYDYSKAEEDHFPVLYYEGTSIPLPFQDDIPLCSAKITRNDISIKEVILIEDRRRIILDVNTVDDAEYKVTGVTIVNLKQDESEKLTWVSSEGGGRIIVSYLIANQQEHWQDSYLLTGIDYEKTVNGEPYTGHADFTKEPVRIPLTLYCDINNVDDWNHYIRSDNNYGNYENYRITSSFSFSGSSSYTINTKLGRLKGETGEGSGMATLSNINLSGSMQNFIFRLNTEMTNLAFENCSISSSDRDGVGLVGASAAKIKNMKFKDVSITNNGAQKGVTGLIGYQIGGSLENINMEGITITCDKSSQSYVGGLVGNSTGSTLYKNIEGKNIQATGTSYIGGMLGYTSRASFEDIAFEDVKITGRSHYVGGIIGHNNSPRTGNKAPHMWNVSLKGTPDKDDDGRVTDSTTVIEIRSDMTGTANYTGGIAGRCVGYQIGWRRAAGTGSSTINVEGIVVKACGSYVGGAFGESGGCQNVTVEDVLITGNNHTRSGFPPEQIGGLSGRQNWENNYNNVYNVKIDVEDYRRVGLLNGYSNTGTNYCYVHKSDLKVTRTERCKDPDPNKASNVVTVWDVGGLIGRNDGSTNYCGVYDSTVVAANKSTNTSTYPGYSNVGGVVGYTAGTVNRCFYYAEPGSNVHPAADEKYVVQGSSYVGGIVGNQNNGNLTISYSNANVIADNKYAGGLSGYYNNGYTVTNTGGKTLYGYSGVGLSGNYFAGTVKAKSCAGGAIGANSMAVSTAVASAHKANGGRSTDTANGGFKSGSRNEREYTWGNLLLARTVSADDGNAHAFSGAQDGFEGKANNWTLTNGNNKSTEDKAFRTLLFAGMKVGTTGAEQELYSMPNDNTVPAYAKNEDSAWRYEMWNPRENGRNNGWNQGYYPTTNARLVTTEDLKGDRQYDTFKALNWITGDWVSSRNGDKTMKGDFYRLIYSTVNDPAEWNAVKDDNRYKNMDYLPHIRVNTKTQVINVNNDKLVKKQSDLGIALTIPEWSGTARMSMSSFSLREEAETYATIYPVDADQVNLEFSQDLVDYGGYFTLSYGDRVITKQLIKKRVYTYSYDYAKNLKLTYGCADIETYEEQMAETGATTAAGSLAAGAGATEAEEGIAAVVASLSAEQEQALLAQEDLLFELDTIYYMSASLARHVMVYGNEYYYISEEGIVHGVGASSSSQSAGAGASSESATSGGDEGVVDETAQTLSGSYITIYNGHALSEDGSVIDVNGAGPIRTAAGCTQLSQTVPVQSFDYGGYRIETYSKFAEVLNSDVVPKEAQILKGYTGNVGFIDGSMENIKDSVLLYTKDGNEYQTILGADGIMIDMFQGDNLNAPEDFKSSGIVYMTNNLNCNVPFVLVEYQNGGIVGYNYMTGEYLFDNSVKNVMSLLDYTKVYFNGDKSMYAQVSSTYAANRKTAEIVGTSERLLELVEGNSDEINVNGNSAENGVKSESEDKEKAGEDKAKTSGNTELAQSGSTGDKLTETKDSAAVGEAKGEDDITAAANNSDGVVAAGVVEGSSTTTETQNGTVQSSNSEDNAITAALGAESANPLTDAEKIVGEGRGQGDNVISGTETGNGSNTEITDSVGGVSSITSASGSNSASSSATQAGASGSSTGNAGDEESKIDIDKINVSALTADQAEAGSGTGAAGSGAGVAGSGAGVAGSGTGETEGGSGEAVNGTGAAGSGAATAGGSAGAAGNGTGKTESSSGTTEQSSTAAKTSTAGTTVIRATDGINNGDSGVSDLGSLDDEERTDALETSSDDGAKDSEKDSSENSDSSGEAEGLITVYNQSTGTYEIVDVEQYFNVPVYRSENQKLQIHDLSAYAGYAQEKEEKKQADGLMLYVLVAVAVVTGVGFTYYYRKRHKYK